MFSERAKELYTFLKNEFPYGEILLWESKELHPYMIHQPISHNILIEMEKELLETVFHLLYDRGENVIIESKNRKSMNYLLKRSDSIILCKKRRKRKTIQKENILTLSNIEIIRLLDEKELMLEAYQGSEKENIVKALKNH